MTMNNNDEADNKFKNLMTFSFVITLLASR